MRFEMPFRKNSEPASAKEERRVPGSIPVKPEPLAESGASGVNEKDSFTGYKLMDGTLIDEHTELDQFDAARGFIRVDGSVGQDAASKTPERENAVEAQDSLEADLIRQQALKMPEGLQEKELLAVLEQKTKEFAEYFDQKWKGKMFESNFEKYVDFECLAKLQGRTAAARVNKMRLEKIAKVEIEQMRGDLLTEQGKLLEELNRTPVEEVEIRRDIQVRIRELGNLLKPENEKKLRAWWDQQTQVPFGDISGDGSDWSKV